jgi:HAE1 family hydrophobic/amphiphilic exporter-1
VKASILPGSPEVQIVYNRDALARYNLDIRTVAELVRNKVQGFEATKYNRKDRKIPVRVRLKDIETADDRGAARAGGEPRGRRGRCRCRRWPS